MQVQLVISEILNYMTTIIYIVFEDLYILKYIVFSVLHKTLYCDFSLEVEKVRKAVQYVSAIKVKLY